MFALIFVAALFSATTGQTKYPQKDQQSFPPECYNVRAYGAAQVKCYTDQGLNLVLPNNPYNSTHVKEANIKNSLDATPEDICDPLNRPKYDAAIHCSLALEISCTPYVYQTLLPDEKNLKKAQDTMCANLDVLNHTCTVNQTSDLVDCGIKKYGQLTVAEANDPLKSTCASYQHAEDCLEEEILECGKANLDLQKTFNQLRVPKICSEDEPLGKRSDSYTSKEVVNTMMSRALSNAAFVSSLHNL